MSHFLIVVLSRYMRGYGEEVEYLGVCSVLGIEDEGCKVSHRTERTTVVTTATLRTWPCHLTS